IQFNTDVLDLKDRKNIDLSNFSKENYVMPGKYTFSVMINKSSLGEQDVNVYEVNAGEESNLICIEKKHADQFGLKAEYLSNLTWIHNGECLNIESIDGTSLKIDLATSSMYVSVPQAYLEYSSDDWDPPSRWDEGIPGFLFDYNMSGRVQKNHRSKDEQYRLSGNGTSGINFGPWRLRADWQATFNRKSGNTEHNENNFEWNRYYLYRALPKWGAKLTVGEDYLKSDIFDSFRYTGASIATDLTMLPPSLRGYAPEITGFAKTNATVTLSQQGRILYETQVAAGPYRIQDINDAVTGKIDVKVEEEDGTVSVFSVNTANIPYLTRPGSVRYKVATGKPSDWKHNTSGDLFLTGEYSWGVANGWSMYGGVISDKNYKAISTGIGKDLMLLGALSFDITESKAKINNESENLKGKSYRLSYSKVFEELDSQVTFAGYRFSEENYMSMNEYLDARYNSRRTGGNKEMYTVTLNKQFREWGLSSYFNYSHQTYWNRPDNDQYNMTLSKYFDIGRFKNISISGTAYRNKYNNTNDDGVYLSLSMPWGNGESYSYNTSSNGGDSTHRVGYSKRISENDNYQLYAGHDNKGVNLSGFYNHFDDSVKVSANFGYQENVYSAIGATLQGGLTLTGEGGALHRTGSNGGTRMLISSSGVSEVPVRGYGMVSRTNKWGKTVITDLNSYYRNKFSVDLNLLNDETEAIKSVTEATLTEGAIGHRKVEVLSGIKVMAVIRLPDGSYPPFGTLVSNEENQTMGIVNDDGEVYLAGVRPGAKASISWEGANKCELLLPSALPANLGNKMLLPCVRDN
ncbi:outer membrane usher protein, partial [Salmonella enterica]|nr:outer membrane usher protein [Salmonella enterica]